MGTAVCHGSTKSSNITVRGGGGKITGDTTNFDIGFSSISQTRIMTTRRANRVELLNPYMSNRIGSTHY